MGTGDWVADVSSSARVKEREMGYIKEKKLKSGTRYKAEVRLKGHPDMTAVFDRKTDAKAWIMQVEADIRAGRNKLYTDSKRRTLSEAIERFAKEKEVSVVKRGHLAWWKKELGSFYLHDVRSSVITEKKQKLLSEKTDKGVIRGKSTCNRYLATLSFLLSVCVREWEWMSENSCRKISREKEPRERIRFLPQEERGALLAASKESLNPYLHTFVVLLLSTGCRYNEARCLKWPEVDLNEGRITIIKSKNGDIRSVPIRGLVVDLLKDLRAQSLSIGGYIFPSPNEKNKPIDLKRAFRTAIRKANLKNFRGHDMRHDYATSMLAQGLSLGEIGHLLGHRSVAMTRRYSHLTESRSIDAVTKMAEKNFG